MDHRLRGDDVEGGAQHRSNIDVKPAKAGFHASQSVRAADQKGPSGNWPMLVMVLKRLLLAVPSLIGVVIVTFLLTRALPGDPAAYFAGPAATKEAIQEIRVSLAV